MQIRYRRAKRGLVLSLGAVSGMLALGALSSCSTAKEPRIAVRTPASSMGNFTAADVSADFRDPSLLNFQLYKNSQWGGGEQWEGGSRDAELDEFNQQSKEVIAAQMNLAKKRGTSQGDRVFHQKSHGCLVGELKVRDNSGVPELSSSSPETMFSGAKKSYTVLVRYSSGVGITESDSIPDVRGIAIKVFGVRDINVPEGKEGAYKTIDLTMTDSPVAFGDDAQEFIEFMKVKDEHASLLSYIKNHARAGKAILASTFKFRKDLTDLQFWAGHPYLLNSNLAMKLNIKPWETAETSSDDYPANMKTWSWKGLAAAFESADTALDGVGAADVGNLAADAQHVAAGLEHLNNFLHDDLVQKSAAGQIRYVLSIQLEKDPTSTPIEKNLTEWTESASPSIPVADLVLDRQAMGDQELDNLCQSARFSPGHYVSEHRPLSNMARGRIFAYRASQIGRGASDEEIPESKILEIRKRIDR